MAQADNHPGGGAFTHKFTAIGRDNSAAVRADEYRVKTSAKGSSGGVLATFTAQSLQTVKTIQFHVTENADKDFVDALATNKILTLVKDSNNFVDFIIDGFRALPGSTGKTWWVALTYLEHKITQWNVRDRVTIGLSQQTSPKPPPKTQPKTQPKPKPKTRASEHNTLFFKTCVNYLGGGDRVSSIGDANKKLRQVADNNYKTYTTATDMNIDMSIDRQASRVDAVFIKATGITSHRATASGGDGSGYPWHTLPAHVNNWEGTPVPTTIAGIQHVLFLVPSAFTAKNVRMSFRGDAPKIYELMLLELALEIDANADILLMETASVDRNSVRYTTPGGGTYRGNALGNERDKWEVNFSLKVVAGGSRSVPSPQVFQQWREQNQFFVFAQEPSRYPARVYPALFMGDRVPVRLRSDNKNAGYAVSIRIGEA